MKYPNLLLTGPKVNLASKTGHGSKEPYYYRHRPRQAVSCPGPACAALWLTLRAGVDDVLAILLALTARPDELEVAMISVTYGNVSLQRSAPPRLSW